MKNVGNSKNRVNNVLVFISIYIVRIYLYDIIY